MLDIIEKINEQIKDSYLVTIESEVSVFEDNYEMGEGELVNSFNNESINFVTNATDIITGIKMKFEEYVEYVIGATYNIDDIQDLDGGSQITVTLLVDDNDDEANDEDIEQWKKGQLDLYTHYNCINIKINGIDISTETIREILKSN